MGVIVRRPYVLREDINPLDQLPTEPVRALNPWPSNFRKHTAYVDAVWDGMSRRFNRRARCHFPRVVPLPPWFSGINCIRADVTMKTVLPSLWHWETASVQTLSKLGPQKPLESFVPKLRQELWSKDGSNNVDYNLVPFQTVGDNWVMWKVYLWSFTKSQSSNALTQSVCIPALNYVHGRE